METDADRAYLKQRQAKIQTLKGISAYMRAMKKPELETRRRNALNKLQTRNSAKRSERSDGSDKMVVD